jgi:diguanylate cyclase (GGDEF)-like protein
MKYDTNQLLYNLKSLFFDYMEYTEGHILFYGEFFEKLLSCIHDALDAAEVSYFKYDEWKQLLFIEASTSAIADASAGFPCDEQALSEMGTALVYSYNNESVKELAEFEAILPISDGGGIIGVLAIKEKQKGSLKEIGCEEAKEIAREFNKLIKTSLSFFKLAKKERRNKQLLSVTQRIHSSMSMDAVLSEVINTLQEVYPSLTYYLLISHDIVNRKNLPIKDLEYDSENAAALQCYVTGTIQMEDYLAEKKSILYAPLNGKQGVYGVLQIIAPHALVFPKAEIEFITMLADAAGGAMENAQLYEQSKRVIADLQLINETSHRLNSSLRLSETMSYMKQQIMKSFKADETGFILLQANGEVTYLDGSTDFFHTKESDLYISYLKEKINADKEALFIGDLSLQLTDGDIMYPSLMAVPMMASDSLKGFAVVLHKKPYNFSFEMFKLLQSLIHHSSLAVVNSMLREELEKMVITDHLTKLYSRSYLDEKIYHSMENDEEGTFILIDIDDFKVVNDTYGHQVGDDILIQVAKLINCNIRETDIGARWGGEELAIYLPKVSLEAGVRIAERLLKRVGELSSPRITISCGVSYWTNSASDNANALFKRADEALYMAKSSGKNKVLVQEDGHF